MHPEKVCPGTHVDVPPLPTSTQSTRCASSTAPRRRQGAAARSGETKVAPGAIARNAAGNPTGAIQALLAAETADPHDPRIPYARATILARLGRLDEALNATRRALEIDPNFSAASSLLQQLEAK